jgi:hypothetical protein
MVTPLIRPDLRCTEIVKYYLIVLLKRGPPKGRYSPTLIQIGPVVSEKIFEKVYEGE